MKDRTFPAAALAILLLVLVSAPARGQDAGAPLDDRVLRSVVEGFHAALAAGDSTAALAFLHPELAVYESGHAESLDEYRSGHLASDIAFSREVRFSTIRDAIVPGGDLAVYLREYSLAGTYRGRAVDAHGVETIVLARTPEGWKIRHVHWSSR